MIRVNWGAKRPPPTFEQFLRSSGLHPDQDETPTWTPPTQEERDAAERAERIALSYRGRLRKDP